MSDVLYSSRRVPSGELSGHLQMIYRRDVPETSEFHGDWGSVAITRSHYRGFMPIDTEQHLWVVIGGPLLCFSENEFLHGEDSCNGSRRIYERWSAGNIDWSEDLSGPFCVLAVDKIKRNVMCITDMMMFIPVFYRCLDSVLTLGTHVDSVARAADRSRQPDLASVVDFVLHDSVTHPYTCHVDVRQCHPGSVNSFTRDEGQPWRLNHKPYWRPEEINPYQSVKEAGEVVRRGLRDYLDRLTEGTERVGQFISAGEDSRAVSGFLREDIQKTAFIFLDGMNLEGRIAKKVARIYGATSRPQFRDAFHYLHILEEASDLIGSGHQYHHAHSLGFQTICDFAIYPAIIGGYVSDSLLKGLKVRKKPPRCFLWVTA